MIIRICPKGVGDRTKNWEEDYQQWMDLLIGNISKLYNFTLNFKPQNSYKYLFKLIPGKENTKYNLQTNMRMLLKMSNLNRNQTFFNN